MLFLLNTKTINISQIHYFLRIIFCKKKRSLRDLKTIDIEWMVYDDIYHIIDIIQGKLKSERQEAFLKFSKKENLELDYNFITDGFNDEQVFSVTLSLQHILDRYLNENDRCINPIRPKVKL